MIQMSKHFQKELDLAIKILKEAGCQEIFIFDSLATGEAKKNSEIDLAVRGCPPDMFFKTLGKLLRKLKHSVNLIDLDSKNPLAESIKEKGEIKRVA
jgi:predicted nucleotidyltransferase